MITLQDWDLHCRGELPLYYGVNGKIIDIPKTVPISFDRTLQVWVLSLPSFCVTFNEIFKTRKECAIFMVEELTKEYLNEDSIA